MSATLQRPPARPPVAAPPGPGGRAGVREEAALLATLALLAAACLPLTRVYVGLDFMRPVLAAVLLSVGLSWGARRLGAGPLVGLAATVAGWVVFVSTAFLGDTLAAGVLPTPETFSAGVALWGRGLQLIQLRAAPAFAETGLLFLTVTGVWAVSHTVEGLVFRLEAPLKAAAMALILWVVPLALAPPGPSAWPWAVPFLVAVALLLLTFVGADLSAWTGETGDARPPGTALYPTGAMIAAVAIVAGALLSGSIPGFGQPPWYELRGMGGTTLTTNPIVDIRSRLVASDGGTVMRVTTPRPVYLRTTALDVYGEAEEWTNAGIRGTPVDGLIPPEVPLGPSETLRLNIEVTNLPGAVLVPAPYQVLQVEGGPAEAFQYDARSSTLTLDRGVTLQTGDVYSVVATIPDPSVDDLATVTDLSADPAYTQLPANVPDSVPALARRIVERAEARTPFDQTLAIQDELRTWTYSTEPPQGHSGRAMQQFLDSRTGYCEQFAGTMAVMLRSLGIPARVAVGFSPGELIEDAAGNRGGTYTISNANAHAWPEVLFPGFGWIAFEPTPRTDGNVLVPTATNLAPSRTVSQTRGREGTPQTAAQDERGLPRNEPGGATEAPPTEAPGTAGGGGAAGSDGGPWGLLLALLAAVVVAGGAFALRTQQVEHRDPLQRVLHARHRVDRVGRGLGVAPAASETDLEYLLRLARPRGAAAVEPARTLATTAASARYASVLPAEAAGTAESAADALLGQLLRDVPPWRRSMVRVRGDVSERVSRLPRLGRRWGPPRA